MKRLFWFGFLGIAAVAAAKEKPWTDLPAWIEDVAKEPVKETGTDPAILLRDDSELTMEPEGVMHRTHRVVIRILDNKGIESAVGTVQYGKLTRVRSNTAWLIRDGIKVQKKSGSDWADVGLSPEGTLFNENRARVIDFTHDAVSGDIFAYESVIDDPALVSQEIYQWGWRIPAREESCRISVPAGFNLSTVLHGTPAPTLEKSADGLTWKWTLTDQPSNREEPLAPPLSAFEPILLLQVQPSPTAANYKPVVFKDWRQLADWELGIAEGTCDQSAAMIADAARLTKDCGDALAKIRALTKAVQNIRYVAVDTNLGRGDGFKPRKASEVYARGYGDCKDKANLLCAMLREAGVTAHLVIAKLGDDAAVYPDLPSPIQFDHAITAIEVDPSVQLPACVNVHGKRLLFFDPTNEFTQLGDLPDSLQGTNVQVLSAGIDELVSLPHLAPEPDFFEQRKVVLALSADGSVTGNASILGEGQIGARHRAEFFHFGTPDDVKKHLPHLLSKRLRTSSFADAVRSEDVATGGSQEAFTFKNSHFLQPISPGVSLAHLDVFNADAIHNLPGGKRHLPVQLEPLVQADEVSLQLPAGTSIDELPAPLSLKSEYGTFSSRLELKEHVLVYSRKLEIKAQIVPAADYGKVRKFFSDLAKADRPAVMLKTAPTVAQAK